MIRIRRTSPSLILRRSRYEIEAVDEERGAVEWRRETSTPVTVIDPHVGVAEAWALVHAADEAWNRSSPEWVSLPRSAT